MSVNRKNRIVQVTNVSPSATSEQLRTLFGHVGVLEEVVVYPPDDKEELASKVCYIRYQEPINAEVALHLNNTVFLDRALIVLPLSGDRDAIPDEKYANLVRAPPNTAAGVLPRTADWPLDVISMVVGRPGEQVIHTMEPRLSSLAFPLYPPLPATTDGSRIEEIRRTILVTNLDPKTTGDQIMVQHSNCAIIKPANNVAMLDETSKRSVTNEQASSVGGHIIYDVFSCAQGSKHSDRRRSRSRSRARRSRSRRRSTSRRYRSRSRDRRRSHSRHSRDRRRSPTQSRSRSRGHRHRTRSRSKDYRRSDHTRSRSHNRKKHRHSRSHSSRRYSRSRSKGHRGDHRDRQNRNTRERDRTGDRDRDREKIRERGREKERERNRGPDRRDREKYRHCERESDDRRDCKPKKHRDVPAKQSHSNGSVRQEKREKNSEINNRPSSILDEVPSSKKNKHTDSISSCSDIEDDNSKICPADSMENGKTQSDDDTQSSNEQPPKPTVVGVKLAGPEDMDHLSPENVQSELPLISHISPESDSSGEAMDTEA
uniref:Serine/arginine-rich splicing factor 11 n=1 Tax=Schistosoma haematobium TaxID=6185 RepID=A0A095ARX3_SCHHA